MFSLPHPWSSSVKIQGHTYRTTSTRSGGREVDIEPTLQFKNHPSTNPALSFSDDTERGSFEARSKVQVHFEDNCTSTFAAIYVMAT
ncbi:unnamed protein product [Calypogeia fissa]